MKDVLFFDSVMKIREKDGVYEICGGEQPKEGDVWDTVQADSSSLEHGEEMAYYDETGGERGNNYFDRSILSFTTVQFFNTGEWGKAHICTSRATQFPRRDINNGDDCLV